MATPMQEAAFDKLVELGGRSVSRAMRESKLPYSPATAKTPKKLTEAIGVQELYKKYGLTRGLVLHALANDIKAKPKKRVPELNLAADILRLKESGGSGNQILVVVLPPEVVGKYGFSPSPESDSKRYPPLPSR
ncbi:MAG: hypothetical protein AAB456_00210 [Patescibacteria group bacterium]